MRRALRTYRDDRKQLNDERLTWIQFESLAQQLEKEAQGVIDDDDVPWPPTEVIASFVSEISKQRKDASASWIEGVEAAAADVASMSAVAANQLQTRGSVPPGGLN